MKMSDDMRIEAEMKKVPTGGRMKKDCRPADTKQKRGVKTRKKGIKALGAPRRKMRDTRRPSEGLGRAPSEEEWEFATREPRKASSVPRVRGKENHDQRAPWRASGGPYVRRS